MAKQQYIDFDAYIHQGEPDKREKASNSTKLEKHHVVFGRLKEKMEEVFNNYGG